MSYCVRLTENELARYKDLGFTDGFIQGAVSLYLEKNQKGKDELPSANTLNKFIDSNKYGLNSLSFYSNREGEEENVGSDNSPFSPFRSANISIKIGDEYLTANNIEHAFLLDFVHNLIGKKGAKGAKDFFDSIKEKSVAEINGVSIEDKFKEEINGKSLLKWFEEKPDLVRQSMLKATATALVLNKRAKDIFLNKADSDLNLKITFGGSKYMPEVLRKAYIEVISDAIRNTALNEFTERSEEEIRALEAGIDLKERSAIEQTFTPIQRESRENYIASRVITLGKKDAKNEDKTFIQVIQSKGMGHYLDAVKEDIRLHAEGNGIYSPEAYALNKLRALGYNEAKRKSGSTNGIIGDLTALAVALRQNGLTLQAEHYKLLLDDLDIDENLKNELLERGKYRQTEFGKILKHFNELKLGIKMPLLKRENIRLSSKFESAEDVTDDIEERNFDFSANEGYAIDSVLKRIRKMLNQLPVMNGDELVLDDLGEVQYLTDTYTYAILQNALQGTRSYEAMRERLEKLSAKYPWVKALTKRLDKPADYKPTGIIDEYDSLHNEFFASFFRSRTYYEIKKDVLVKSNIPLQPDTVELKTFGINDDSISYINYSEWSTTYMQGIVLDREHSIYDTSGNIHRDKFEAFKDFVDKLYNEIKYNNSNYAQWENEFLNNKKTQDAIRTMLKSIGIAPEGGPIFDYETNPVLAEYKRKKISRPIPKLLNEIFDKVFAFSNEVESYLKTKKDDSNVVEVNLFNQFKQQYYRIGKLIQSNDSDTFLRGTFRNNGKMYNSYTTPTYMQILMDKLSGVEVEDYDAMIQEEFLKDNFFKYNYVIQQLARKPEEGGLESRELIDYKEILIFRDKEFDEWTEEDKYIMQLDEFNRDKTSAWYRIPLAGEIKRAGYYRFEKILDSEKLEDLFIDLAKQELERIKETLRWREESKKTYIAPVDRLIEKGDKFLYLPALNTLQIDGKTLLESLESGVIGTEKFDEREILRKFVNKVLDDIVVSEIDKISKYNRIENSKSELIDFILNDLYFRTQFSQFTAGDLANFKDIIDFQKRYKQTMSSTTRLNSGNDTQKTLYISDEVLASTVLPEISAIVKERVKNKEITEEEGDIIINSFKNINATDGQAYRTIDGYKYIMEKTGQWTDEMEEFKKKLDEAFKSKSADVHISYTEAQNFFFNAIKPLVYGSSMVDTGMINKQTGEKIYKRINHQHKNSEVLMLAINSFATTSPTLRALTKFARDKGIHVFEFASAVKVGTQGVVNLLEKNIAGQTITVNELDSDGKTIAKDYTFGEEAKHSEARETIAKLLEEGKITKEEFQRLHKVINNTTEEEIESKLKSATIIPNSGELNPSVVHEIPYSSYGFQVNTPEHYYDASVLIGTQFRKLITAGINPSNTYVVNTLNTDGMETTLKMSGGTLMQTINGKIIENVYDKYEEVRKIFEDPLKLESIIQSEISSNPRYGTEVAKFFKLINDGTIDNPHLKFEMALEDPQNAKIIEAIFSGIAKNRINKMKTAGGSLIQMSNFTLSDKLQIQMKPDGKSIDYVPAYVPIYSKKLLEFYSDNNGNVDIKKIEKEAPELLEIIGYRIPTESKHSMLPIRIVGFLPNFNGSSIVLPADITAITGSDFDIDKLYIMRPYLNVEKTETDEIDREGKPIIKRRLNKLAYTDGNGFLEGSTPEENYAMRNNFLFDSYMAILKSEHSTAEIFDPSGFDALNAEAKESFLSSFTYQELYNMVEKSGVLAEMIKNKEISLTNNDIENKAMILSNLNPGRVEKIIKTYESSNTPFLSSTMHYFETQNAVGLDLVGISANANTFMAVAQQIKGELQLKKPIEYDGNIYKGYGEILSPTGKNIQRTVGQFVIAAVDNVKSPALAYMKADVGNLGSIIAGVALGIPTKDLAVMSNLGMFSTKRTLNKGKSLSHYMKVLNEIKGVGDVEASKTPLTQESLNLLKAMLPDIKAVIDKTMGDKINYVEAARALVQTFNKTNGDEFRAIRDAINAMIKLEEQLIDLGDAFKRIIGVTKLDTFRGAVGPTAADTLIKYLQVKDDVAYLTSEASPIAVSPAFLNTDNRESTREEVRDALINSGSHFYKAFFHFGMEASFDYMSQHFNVLNPNFLPIIDRLRSLGMQVNAKNINLAYEHFMLYHLHGTSVMNDTLNNIMLKDISLQFTQLQEKYKELSSFLIFKTMRRFQNGQISTLDFVNANELEAQRRDQFTREWEYLLDIGVKDPSKKDISDFAINLYRYGIYRGNIGYKAKGINHLAPARLKRAFFDYYKVVGNMRNIVDSIGNNGDERFVRQFLANTGILYENPRNDRFTKKSLLDALESTKWYIKELDKDKTKELGKEFTLVTDGETPPGALLIDSETYVMTYSQGNSFVYTKLPRYHFNSPFVRYSRIEDYPSELLNKDEFRNQILENVAAIAEATESKTGGTEYEAKDYGLNAVQTSVAIGIDLTNNGLTSGKSTEGEIAQAAMQEGKNKPRKSEDGLESCIKVGK